MRWKLLFAVLLGLLLLGVTAGSASALQVGDLSNNQLEAFRSSFQLHERALNSEFLKWYNTHYGRLSKSLNQKELTKIFAEFLKEDPIALKELREIIKIQRSVIDLGLTHQSDYYYPWVPLYDMASTFTAYGYNEQTEKEYVFLPRMEIPGVVGLTNEAIAGAISKVAHDWVSAHGAGWITVA